jgi:hypothetical protein
MKMSRSRSWRDLLPIDTSMTTGEINAIGATLKSDARARLRGRFGYWWESTLDAHDEAVAREERARREAEGAP